MTRGRKASPQAEAIRALRDHLGKLAEHAQGEITAHQRRTLQAEVREVIGELGELLQSIDPISLPSAVFDPSNPKIVGRFVALAMVAQERKPLAELTQAYGSGVYAIYYTGPYDAYAPIRGTETPIYVGKSGPQVAGARTPLEQGPKLTARLKEHRGNISKATATLDIKDFHYRALVVQSGLEVSAEEYLIHLFRPIWNKEVGILFGLGKHGDASETRANKRSPWDTLHEARAWATTEIGKSPETIKAEVAAHYAKHPPFPDLQSVLDSFIDELRQV